MHPLISILMPVKNSEKFLSMTINSIIDQTEKNWELIIVNDGSIDNILNILQNFAEKEPRIKIFNNEEGSGIIPALRTAFMHSNGDLVTRMDSDDLMAIYKLEKIFGDISFFRILECPFENTVTNRIFKPECSGSG